MVNFLRNQSRGGGNSTADMLRQQLALSAAQRISGLQSNRFNQEEPQPELIRPNFLDTMAPSIGKGIEYAAGREQEGYQQAREDQQQQEATEELANIYAQEFDIPIDRARLIASAPPEERKAVLADLNARRKEERSFENKKELEGIKQQNKINLADYKKEINAKFPAEDPNRAWYSQGLKAVTNLKKLSKKIPSDPQGFFDKFGYERPDQEQVKNWITMAVAAAAPIAHLNDFQRKELESNYLEQYYKGGEARQNMLDQLIGTFTPDNYESIQERSSQMYQRPNQPEMPQDQQLRQEEQSSLDEQSQVPQQEGWVDWATRAGARALVNYGERAASALAYGPTGIVNSLAGEAANLAAPYLPEFVQKSIAINQAIMNPFKGISPEALKEASPQVKEILEPQGRLDRITDSITREVPEAVLGLGLGASVVKPLVAGVLGGLSDEALDAIKAPEISKLAARLITGVGLSATGSALKDLSKGKQPLRKWTKDIRASAGETFDEIAKKGKDIYGDPQYLNQVREEMSKQGAAFSDPKGLQHLETIVAEASPIGVGRTPYQTVGRPTMASMAKLAKDMNKRLFKETDPDMKKILQDVKQAAHNTINSMAEQAPELVTKYNQANAAYAATKQLNSIESLVDTVSKKIPGAGKTILLSSLASAIGFKYLIGSQKGLALGAAYGLAKGAGATLRTAQYLKNPIVQKQLMEFVQSGLTNDMTSAARNYRDIIEAFKTNRKAKRV